MDIKEIWERYDGNVTALRCGWDICDECGGMYRISKSFGGDGMFRIRTNILGICWYCLEKKDIWLMSKLFDDYDSIPARSRTFTESEFDRFPLWPPKKLS